MPITIKCHGEFYAREGQLKMVKAFTEAVRAPSLEFFRQTFEKYTGTDDNGNPTFSSASHINVRGVLKKRLLPMILKHKYEGVFVRVRQVFIDEVISEDGSQMDLPHHLLSLAQLEMKIKRQNIPIDAASYLTADDLRTDVAEYEQDPETFKRNFVKKQQRRKEEREFNELNGLVPTNAAKNPPRGIAAVAESQANTEQQPF